MRATRFWTGLGCVAASAVLLMAQADRKPGLYEMTSNMTWQQSPFPAGMQMPPGAHNPFGGGPHTSQVCLTQELIDRYGGPVPQSRGDCQVKNMVKNTTGMTADYVCTGSMSGTGRLEANWTGSGQSHSKVHFTGTMQMGQRSTPVEWTMESTSNYKGSDCGSVKPMPLPPE
ncbi:MAG TPA: DUF3617 family protein [Terracidiphilus sp.]|jgi:hypothetical protein|nr:DUF3617 family protein [Terracidiphilus sp.]